LLRLRLGLSPKCLSIVKLRKLSYTDTCKRPIPSRDGRFVLDIRTYSPKLCWFSITSHFCLRLSSCRESFESIRMNFKNLQIYLYIN